MREPGPTGEAKRPRQVAFASHTVLGLVRVFTIASRLGASPMSLADAWAIYESLRQDSAVAFVEESPRCHLLLGGYVAEGIVQVRTLSDA